MLIFDYGYTIDNFVSLKINGKIEDKFVYKKKLESIVNQQRKIRKQLPYQRIIVQMLDEYYCELSSERNHNLQFLKHSNELALKLEDSNLQGNPGTRRK